MSDRNKPINVHYHSAREHLAGVRAAAAWHQELAALHLLRTQSPISHEPVTPPPPTGAQS